MKKFMILALFVFMVGCSSGEQDTLDIDARANDIIELVATDGVTDLKVVSTKEGKAVIENDYCQINLFFEDNKLVSVYSLSKKDKDDLYSCVFRTIFKDKDLLGDDEEKYQQFLEMFREGKDFEFDGLKITNNFFDMTIERK